jgi:hypothetical protein
MMEGHRHTGRQVNNIVIHRLALVAPLTMTGMMVLTKARGMGAFTYSLP